MSQKNKDVVIWFINEILNPNRPELAEEVFHVDATSTGTTSGLFGENKLKDLRTFSGLYHNSFSDFHVEIKEIFSERDKVFLAIEISGTHDGEDFLGIRARGKKISWTSFNIYYLKKHKIWKHWGISNLDTRLDLLR
ncbi:ester cyclase [Aureivirga marina]|uniref:ester cyclase n=1 Tax=Aureivirga marina TaxID=1182451 RepID=UPI0018C93F25|nr:ester cyclase [Aureivirga marina]